MIKLEDISTIKMLKEFPSSNQMKIENEEISKALSKYYIRDYKQLDELINSGDPYFNIDFFKNWLELIKENVAYANELGIKPALFTFNNYITDIEPKSLKLTEKKTFCRNLAINNPILGPSEKLSMVKGLRIYEAKLLLSKVVAYDKIVVGRNAFLDRYPNFNVTDAIQLVKAINFYEQQIYRQSLETDKVDVNLFRLNKRNKVKIIEEEIEDIVEYLVDSANICVWGKLTSNQKQMLVSAIKNHKKAESKQILERLITLLANYTTLSEIEYGVKQKTLDRFIIK